MASEVGVLDIAPEEIVAARATAARPHVPRRHVAGPHHRRRRIEGAARGRTSLRRMAARRVGPPRRPTDASLPHAPARLGGPATAGVRLHDRGAEDPPVADGEDRRTSRSDRWVPTRRSPHCRIGREPLFDYFQQLFAQVTNPPLDAIREELVTSLSQNLGPEGNLLDPNPASCRQIVLPHPILSNTDLAKLLYINEDGDQGGFRPFAVDGLYPVAEGGEGLRRALEDVRARGRAAIADGAKVIILSDRHSNEELAPIPSLLLVSAVHHHLIREKTRTQVGLVLECGDAREVHHMALLLGYGAVRGQPVPRVRDDRRSHQRRLPARTLQGSGRAQLHQGVRQGRPQDHVEDGDLDSWRRTPARRSSRRSVSRRTSSTSTSAAPHRSSGASASTSSPRKSRRATSSPTSTAPKRPRTATCGRAASTNGGAKASTTCSTRRRCSSATRGRARSGTGSSRSTRSSSTSSRRNSPRCAACSGSATAQADPDRRSRAGLGHREALLDRPCRYGYRSHGSARYALDRDELDWWQVEHRRRWRGRLRLCALPNGDRAGQRSSRSPSARFGVTANTSSTRTTWRSRWRRARSRAKGGQPRSEGDPDRETRHASPGVGLISPPPHHDIYSIEDLTQLIL